MKSFILGAFALLATSFAALADTVVLAWTARPAVEQITSYNLYQKGSNGGYTLLGNTSTNEITIDNINPGEVIFALAAVNVWGEGPISEVGTPPKPGQVADLHIKSIRK